MLKIWAFRWRHNGHDGVSNYQPHNCSLNSLFGRRSKKTSKFRVTGLCAGNSPGTGEFPAQMASNAENVSIWWRHHGCRKIGYPSETHLQMRSRGTSFAHNVVIGWRIDLKCCTEHGSTTHCKFSKRFDNWNGWSGRTRSHEIRG